MKNQIFKNEKSPPFSGLFTEFGASGQTRIDDFLRLKISGHMPNQLEDAGLRT